MLAVAVLANDLDHAAGMFDRVREEGADLADAGGGERNALGADEHMLAESGPIFDGLYEFPRRLLPGREPV